MTHDQYERLTASICDALIEIRREAANSRPIPEHLASRLTAALQELDRVVRDFDREYRR